MKITDDKTIRTFSMAAAAFTVYTSGVFFAKEYYSKNSLKEIYVQRQEANSIVKQGERIGELMKYYTPENKILANNTLDSLIKEKIAIDKKISNSILENDYSALKSWIYLFE
jgi:ADP-glucose pyrophosphorylase